MICRQCASEISDEALVCPFCNASTFVLQKNRGKTPLVAVILGFLMPGLGQFYNRDYGKAVIVFVCFWISIFVGIGIFVWILGMIEAYQGSKRYNRKHA